jgi:hypothetical protein
MQQGYSGTPLIKKLGIKASDLVKIINAPEAYLTGWEKTSVARSATETNCLILCIYLRKITGHSRLLFKKLLESLNRLPPFGYPGIKRARGSRQI